MDINQTLKKILSSELKVDNDVLNEKNSELMEIESIENFKTKFERINDFIEDIKK